MRILIFSTNYLPAVGGAELAVKEITDRLPGHAFDMITPRFSRERAKRETIGNVRVFRVGFGVPFDRFLIPLFGTFRALMLHRREHYDAAWAMMASQAAVAAAFFKIVRRGVPLVVTLQEGDEESHLKRYVLGVDFLYRILIRPWHRLAVQRADHITVISEYLKERAKAAAPKTPVSVIPNGVDVERFAPRDPSGRTRGAGEARIITTSRLVHKNGVDTLIESLRFLPGSVKVVIIGDGPDRPALERLARKLGLADRVAFEGGMDHSEIPRRLQEADIFARPSRSEGFGSSFVEAMAAGLPVVATRVGGIKDFLRDGETGVVCEPDDPESVAKAVERLLDDELRERVSENARKMVEERYTWDCVAEEMKKVFVNQESGIKN